MGDTSLASALEQLAGWRARGTRASEEVVRKGMVVLAGGGLQKMGDEGGWRAWSCWAVLTRATAWAFLEQLALAALGIGGLDLADVSVRARCGGRGVDGVF